MILFSEMMLGCLIKKKIINLKLAAQAETFCNIIDNLIDRKLVGKYFEECLIIKSFFQQKCQMK